MRSFTGAVAAILSAWMVLSAALAWVSTHMFAIGVGAVAVIAVAVAVRRLRQSPSRVPAHRSMTVPSSRTAHRQPQSPRAAGPYQPARVAATRPTPQPRKVSR